MALYLRLNLWYKDGTMNELRSAIPEEVAKAIENKGMEFVSVYVDRDIVYTVPDNSILDKFRQG